MGKKKDDSQEFQDYKPVWGRVLVLPVDISETDEDLARIKTSIPGFEIARDNLKQEQYAQNEGYLIAAGGDAFHDWEGNIPEIGDRVLFNKYAGFILKDGEHRIINDTDIQAVIGE